MPLKPLTVSQSKAVPSPNMFESCSFISPEVSNTHETVVVWSRGSRTTYRTVYTLPILERLRYMMKTLHGKRFLQYDDVHCITWKAWATCGLNLYLFLSRSVHRASSCDILVTCKVFYELWLLVWKELIQYCCDHLRSHARKVLSGGICLRRYSFEKFESATCRS